MTTAIGPPKLGMNCSRPANNAHSGAHGIPMVKSPTSHSKATTAESRHWATNQFFRAVPVVRASSRQAIPIVNHKGHEGTRREKARKVQCHFTFVILRALCG